MVFENRFTTTDAMYKEYVYKVICRKSFLYGPIVAVAAAALFVLFYQSSPVLAGVEGAVALMVVSVLLLTPKMMLKRLLDTDSRLHGGSRPETLITFGDKIQMGEGDQSIAVEYSKIMEIYRLKTCSVLMFTKQAGILYAENAFTTGTAADFERFILEKCPQVQKIVKR